MKISMITAMANGRVIGKDNKMPWHLPEDLQHFKRVTIGKPVLMGRKTFESIGRPLPGRQNIVISRDNELTIPGVIVVNSIAEALFTAWGNDELVVIGGAKLYEQMLPMADRLYLTKIDIDVGGDAFFPYFDLLGWNHSGIEFHKSSTGIEFTTYTLNK